MRLPGFYDAQKSLSFFCRDLSEFDRNFVVNSAKNPILGPVLVNFCENGGATIVRF
jgi:hypothetical protein